MASGRRPPIPHHVLHGLAVDVVTATVVSAWRSEGIDSVLLKGPSIAQWLYPGEPEARPYRDSDLLVAPGDVPAAEAALARLGFEHPPLDDIPGDRPWHAHVWLREDDRASVDLHRTLIGARADPSTVWSVLSSDTEEMQVGGILAPVLSRPARAMHVALHAAQDGARLGKPLRDLERALEVVPGAVWIQAAEIAKRVDAVEALSVGLRLKPAGTAVADSIGLPSTSSVEAALRAEGSPTSALALEWFSRQPGARAKLAFAARKIAPPPEFMRAKWSLARRGPGGLALAYLWRPLWMLGRMVRAARIWLQARRKARARDQ